jgi:hypothetical protein
MQEGDCFNHMQIAKMFGGSPQVYLPSNHRRHRRPPRRDDVRSVAGSPSSERGRRRERGCPHEQESAEALWATPSRRDIDNTNERSTTWPLLIGRVSPTAS